MTPKGKTLSAPLRVYWDLVPATGGGLSEADAARVAEELAGLKVFFVTLGLSGRVRQDAGLLVAALKKGGVRVTVSVAGQDSFPGWENLAEADGIDLRADDAGSFKALVDAVVSGAPAKKTVSVSVVPSKKKLGQIVGIFSIALDAGIRNFNLPNPDLISNKEKARDYALGNADRETIKRGLEGLLGPLGQDVRVSVHDLFLHQALKLPGLGGRIEYAGCQAGDAIAYIDGSGLVYPCASWPVVFGSLRESSFREIWSTAGRKALREGLTVTPAGCASCPEATVCKGGCRGLAWAIGDLDGRDPNCEG